MNEGVLVEAKTLFSIYKNISITNNFIEKIRKYYFTR